MSKIIFYIVAIILLATHFMYYPKWQKSGSEATLSWDVSGYYMYLPATFIYKDLKGCGFKDDILKKYGPTPDFQQAYLHEESGNYVMKYSIGQAIVFSPFFAAAHLYASNSAEYPADGFSRPYQMGISICALFIALLGLYYLRKVLLEFFSEWATGLTLIGIVVGSNYLNYAAIDGAMTHNTLFTIYTLLIYTTIQFYKSPSMPKGLLIGFLVGLAALIRPTEIISMIIPVLWGVNMLKKESILSRLSLFWEHKSYLISAVVVCGAIGFIQLLYWHHVTGDWLVYSYEDQGFSWFKPHLMDGLFSYKSGWLLYSPLMIFSVLGFYALWKNTRPPFFATFTFAFIFIYIAFAWDLWWYGGALGQRAMVQAYPVLAFPLAAFFTWILSAKKVYKIILGSFIVLFLYANVWFTHQAHLGGMLHVGQMTKRYFWATLFTYKEDLQNLKLLDGIKYLYSGERANVETVFRDTATQITLNGGVQYSPEIVVSTSGFKPDFDWYRVSADCILEHKEWNFWTMTHFFVQIKNHDDILETYMIRIQRQMNGYQTKNLFIDIKNPHIPHTDIVIQFWNGHGHKEINIKNIQVEQFTEK